MKFFSTKSRIAGAVVAIVLACSLAPKLAQDRSSQGLWVGMIFMAVMMAVVGIEAIVEKFRKPPA